MIKRYWVLVAVAWSSMVAAQTASPTSYVYDTTTNSTATSTNNNTNVSTSNNTNVNQNINSGTITNINQSNATSASTSANTNVNQNTNLDTSFSTVNQNTVTSNTNVSTDNSTINQTVNQTSNTTSVNSNLNSNVNVSDSKSTSYSEVVNRQIIDQNVKSPPPSAIAPSMMSYSQDLCTTGMSGAVQTQIFGVSAGKAIRDSNCERIKLSKTLYDMGMRVAAVSLLCQDDRVFRSMEMAGTPCPYMGLIGANATEAWASNPEKRPDAKKVK